MFGGDDNKERIELSISYTGKQIYTDADQVLGDTAVNGSAIICLGLRFILYIASAV